MFMFLIFTALYVFAITLLYKATLWANWSGINDILLMIKYLYMYIMCMSLRQCLTIYMNDLKYMLQSKGIEVVTVINFLG